MCGVGRQKCDEKYGQCMLAKCRELGDRYDREECEKLGRILLQQAVYFGCDKFRIAQTAAGTCEEKEEEEL